MRRAWILLSLVGCGRIYFDPLVDGGQSGDAFGARCGPWTGDVLVTELQSTAFDWDPTFSPDGNAIVFSSDRITPSRYQLYVSTRSGGLQFGPPQIISVINTGAIATSPTWLPTGDGIYFVSDGTGDKRLWYSSYGAGVFGVPVLVNDLSAVYVQGPGISHDGLELLYTDDSVTPMKSVMYRATRSTLTSTWTVSGPVPELDVNGSAGWPTFAPDDLSILFQSFGHGSPRLFASQRASRTSPFSTPVEVTEVVDATGLNYTDPEISPDGTILLHGRENVGSTTSFDIYASTRTCN